MKYRYSVPVNHRTSLAWTLGITISGRPIDLLCAARWIHLIFNYSEVKIGLYIELSKCVYLFSMCVK